MYGLAIRMLWDPHDAQDATQEILVKVVTRLDRFRGDSALRTWVYRVAVNHLLTARRRRVEQRGWTFEAFAEDLAAGLDMGAADASSPAEELLAEEVKVGCTLGMLQCLDRPQRVAYILGEVFGLPSESAAAICTTTPAAYRKRLSRARAAVRGFVADHCGIVNPQAACRCTRRTETAVRLGRVDPDAPTFAGHPQLTRTLPSPPRSTRWKTSTTPPRCSAPIPSSPPPTPSGAPSPAPSPGPTPSWTTNHPIDHPGSLRPEP